MSFSAFFGKLAGMGIGEICSGIGGLAKDIRQAITGEMSAEDKATLEGKLLELDAMSAQLDAKVIEIQANVIMTEAQGESPLQRNWRPLLMVLFGIIIANNYIIYPYLVLFFDAAPQMEIPPDMWGLLKIGVGGYVITRGGEKMIKSSKYSKNQ
jgi:hypothetical protein